MSEDKNGSSERFMDKRLRVGSWYMSVEEWRDTIAIILIAPFTIAFLISLFITGFFSEGGSEDFWNFLSTVYWWVFVPVFILCAFIFVDEGSTHTKDTLWVERREEIKESPEYKFKAGHIESMRKDIGDYEADRLIEELLRKLESA